MTKSIFIHKSWCKPNLIQSSMGFDCITHSFRRWPCRAPTRGKHARCSSGCIGQFLQDIWNKAQHNMEFHPKMARQIPIPTRRESGRGSRHNLVRPVPFVHFLVPKCFLASFGGGCLRPCPDLVVFNPSFKSSITRKVGPRFVDFCSCCCLPLLPHLPGKSSQPGAHF